MKIQTSSSENSGSYARLRATRTDSFSVGSYEFSKRTVIRTSVVVVALVLAILAISLWASTRSEQAQAAFNNAMDVYDSPIQQAGQPPIPNVKTYPSAAARAKDAHPLFQEGADKYGFFTAGMNARYFAGLTAQDLGNNAEAEADLKKASTSRDTGLAALAKRALASLYAATGRQSEGIKLYRELIDHPALTVSANAARLALANMIQATNPQGARELYAKVKDSDKAGVAGQVATQKLGGK